MKEGEKRLNLFDLFASRVKRPKVEAISENFEQCQIIFLFWRQVYSKILRWSILFGFPSLAHEALTFLGCSLASFKIRPMVARLVFSIIEMFSAWQSGVHFSMAERVERNAANKGRRKGLGRSLLSLSLSFSLSSPPPLSLLSRLFQKWDREPKWGEDFLRDFLLRRRNEKGANKPWASERVRVARCAGGWRRVAIKRWRQSRRPKIIRTAR